MCVKCSGELSEAERINIRNIPILVSVVKVTILYYNEQ